MRETKRRRESWYRVGRDRLATGLLVGMCLSLFACRASVEPSKVAGHYRATYSFGTDDLDLAVNGTFRQRVEVYGPPREQADQRGTWWFDAAQQRITLDSCLVIADGFDRFRADFRLPEVCDMPVWRLRGSGDVRIGSDEGEFYRRINP